VQSLLFLVHRMPFPPNKGDKVRSYNLLRFLARWYRIHLGTFIDDPSDIAHVDSVRAFCAGSHFAHLHPGVARLTSLTGLFARKPLTLRYYENGGMQRWVNATIAKHSIKRILVFSSCMAQFIPHDAELSTVVDFVDVDSDKWRQYSERHLWPYSMLFRREAHLLLEWERKVARRFSYSLLVTRPEADLFASLVPEAASRVVAIANGVNTEFFAPDPSRSSPYPDTRPVVAFTGAMDYWPNVDAATWFAREVLPQIVAAVPGVRFWIVGRNPASAVSALQRDAAIAVTGQVEDVRPYLQHASVIVAPLRVARGVQNKILEAMAMGRPVIASAMCAAGLSARPGIDFEVAQSAKEFAVKAIELLRSTRSAALGEAARARVQLDYSWERNLAPIPELIERGLKAPSDGAPVVDHAHKPDEARV
jgi:sugar transferase (PEP-CTERM/EpsH1 system associated)